MTLIQLGSVSVTRVSSQTLQSKTSLTRWWNVVLKLTVPGLADHDLVGQGLADPTHNTTTRLDILSASTCSALSIQKGRVLPQRWTYRNENRKHYHIVNKCCATSDSSCVPHDFFPCQAYLIFRRGDNKPGEMKR